MAQDLLIHTLAFCDDCLNRQDYTAAWQALCRAVSLDPNRADVLSHRGRLALFLKDTETAQRDFAAAIKLDPRCSAALSGLARCHWQLGEPAEAEAAAYRALDIDPLDENAIQIKTDLQAEPGNGQLHGPRNMDQLETSAEREDVLTEAADAPASPTADRDTAGTAIESLSQKPRVLMLVDRPNWAYDTAAQAISRLLSDEFVFRIGYVRDRPDLDAWPFDLLYVFFWGETYQRAFIRDPRRIVKEISSHRWALEDQYGRLSPAEAALRYLRDASTFTTTSHRLRKLFAPHLRVLHTPNGFDPKTYFDQQRRSGALSIGWAGNVDDACKGLHDILKPAAKDFDLHVAGGGLSTTQMADFYNTLDVFCVASAAEGEPLTLIEAMACGCFPVCVDVGIVPELIRHGENGLIVRRSPEAFREAYVWCAANLDRVRAAGRENAVTVKQSRTWDAVGGFWREALREGLQTARSSPAMPITEPESARIWSANLGENATLGEWPERAEAAARLVGFLPLQPGDSLIDLGCGHQTIRHLLPKFLRYVPVDQRARSADCLVCDLNTHYPAGHHRVVVALGLIEYLDNPQRFLRLVSQQADFAVFSYNSDPDPERRKRQHWQPAIRPDILVAHIRSVGGRIRDRLDMGRGLTLYSTEFTHQGLTKGALHRSRRVALLSAGVTSSNSGDAIITDAIQRLLAPHACEIFPLLRKLTAEEVERINACEQAVICGTNLYQHIFSCALSAKEIQRIKVPILPLGIGASAPIGTMPSMGESSKRVVRMLHERCPVGSVRDPLSLRFVQSLGIKNVKLTGCPVLFHGLTEPNFCGGYDGPLYLSIRARLLHVEDHWLAKEVATLRAICRKYHPMLVLQSPYDLPIAQELAREFGVSYVCHDNYSAKPLIEAVGRAGRTAGFRLHFGMLGLSHGRTGVFIGSDTRVAEFCAMVNLPWHKVQDYQDEDLLRELDAPQADMSSFLKQWRYLRDTMAAVLDANRLSHVWSPPDAPELLNSDSSPADASIIGSWPLKDTLVQVQQLQGAKKPRVLLIADVPDWIFARHCQMLKRFLGDRFEFSVQWKGLPVAEDNFDLIYPLEWNLVSFRQIGTPAKYVTGIRSHCSWKDEEFSSFVNVLSEKFQRVHVVSRRLEGIFRQYLPRLARITHGVDTELFAPSTKADQSGCGQMRIGWAGNRRSSSRKGLEEIIEPLGRLPGVELVFCGYSDRLHTTDEMVAFYNSIDAYVCASDFEGNNNSLMEAASMQRALITTNCGAVPEYLQHNVSALIVERELSNFIRAVEELRDNPGRRVALGENARTSVQQHFEWRAMAENYATFFEESLARQRFSLPDPQSGHRSVLPAEAISTSACRAEPVVAPVLVGLIDRAMSSAAQGHKVLAELLLEEALEKFPDHPDVLKLQREWQTAEAIKQQLAPRGPTRTSRSEVTAGLGSTACRSEDTANMAAKGEVSIRQPLPPNPEDVVARRMLAQGLIQRGCWAEAAQVAYNAFTQNPEAEDLYHLAQCFNGAGDLPMARMLCEEALRSRPGLTAAQDLLDGSLLALPQPPDPASITPPLVPLGSARLGPGSARTCLTSAADAPASKETAG